MAASGDVFVLIKPDGVRRGLTFPVIEKFEAAGFVFVEARRLDQFEDLAAELYPEHTKKEFFPALAEFMASGDTVAVHLSGGTIAEARAVLGATNPAAAAPGTIRREFALQDRPIRENVAHCSDTPEATARDIERWFSPR